MRRTTGRIPLSVLATAVAVGCAGPGAPSPADTLTYGVPSPPTAVYQIEDTMSIAMDTPGGAMEILGTGSVTLRLEFRTDPGGVAVVGTVDAFSGSLANPLMGTETAGLEDLGGELGVVIGGSGVVENASFPELSGPVAQVSSFPVLAYLLFPRLPDGDVEPGATWVDTVTISTDSEPASTTTSIATHTLVGDTVVEGQSLVHIAVHTELETEATMEQGGMSLTQRVAGSTDGFFLWDPARRLVAYAEYARDMEGTVSMGTMGGMGMAITGPTRIRLEG